MVLALKCKLSGGLVLYRALFIFVFFFSVRALASKDLSTDKINYSHQHTLNDFFPSPLKKIFFKQNLNHKLAAILAFPFPFGCVGLHRVYLGTAPHVPIIYAATAGGVFGIIPFIDCLVLLADKNSSSYENNKNVIMWIKQNK